MGSGLENEHCMFPVLEAKVVRDSYLLLGLSHLTTNLNMILGCMQAESPVYIFTLPIPDPCGTVKCFSFLK